MSCVLNWANVANICNLMNTLDGSVETYFIYVHSMKQYLSCLTACLCLGVNLGRGRGSYDEIERRGITITTNSVTVYHSSEKEYRQLEEKEWGHFYSAESKIIMNISIVQVLTGAAISMEIVVVSQQLLQ